MASAFGHAVLAGAIGATLPKVIRKPLVIWIGMLCSAMPDLDVVSFRFGISYGSFWGHRGFTHSIVFGLLFGIVLSLVMHHKSATIERLQLAVYYSICTISHGFLDGLTTGGMGVAYFSPFDDGRYFLPYRIIQVSPLSISKFFDSWGLAVIKSELVWIGIPSLIIIALSYGIRSFHRL